jgi:hypothetical protein
MSDITGFILGLFGQCPKCPDNGIDFVSFVVRVPLAVRERQSTRLEPKYVTLGIAFHIPFQKKLVTGEYDFVARLLKLFRSFFLRHSKPYIYGSDFERNALTYLRSIGSQSEGQK